MSRQLNRTLIPCRTTEHYTRLIMSKYILLLLILTGCASSPSDKKILNAPLAESDDENAIHALCYSHLYGDDGAQKKCENFLSESKILNMPLANIWPLAESGDENAMHALCYRHLYGKDGAKKDYEIAYKWCKKSAEKGHNSSLTLIAEMHYFGHYIEQDYAKAFENYQKAANLEHDHAQLVLYVMYEKGQGIEKNLEKAKQWLKRSARNGNVQAQRLLAK